MIPLRDDNPTTIQPVVTIALIVVASAVFLWQLTLSPAAEGTWFEYATQLMNRC